MVNVRPHQPDAPNPLGPADANAQGSNPRLNLLLSCAHWNPHSWADRLPTLLEPMGVRSVRAASGNEASRVIQDTTVHIAVVDLALPMDHTTSPSDEGGPGLLKLLGRLAAPPPTVVVKRQRSARDDHRELSAALRAGAFAVIDRPHDASDLELLLEVLRRCLSRHYEGQWPGTT
jgi:CheY-like chemotaxis protein